MGMMTEDKKLHTFLVRAGGLAFECAEQGDPDGIPLVFLHGITDSWRSFEAVLPHIDRRFRVLAISQRGHGESEKPRFGYRTRDFAADLETLLPALDCDGAVLVGHSMGTANAMRLVIDRPDLVRGLVATGAFARFSDKADLVDYIRRSIDTLSDPISPVFATEFQQSTVARPVAQAFIARMVAQSLKVPVEVWKQAFAGLLEDDFSDHIHRITVPTLVLQGTCDSMVPASDTALLRSRLPHCQVTVWEGAGHAPHWEDPAGFAKLVEAFAAQFR